MSVRLAITGMAAICLLTGCQAAGTNAAQPTSPQPSAALATQAADTTPFPAQMKGWELYSWQQDGKWYFSLLPGTNRSKTWTEIAAPTGADGLTSQTDLAVVRGWFPRMGKDADLFWAEPGAVNVDASAKERLSYPPDEVFNPLDKAAKDAGVRLQANRK